MNGSQRVIIFCILTTILPTILIVIPLYLRHYLYADVMYKIYDSDVIQIHKGQSSIFCEKHQLKMNKSFSAFQMKGMPPLSKQRKHIKLRKSMILPDDTLEYWGFYLFNGATVELKACSRHEGSKVMIVKGQKVLDTCGILNDNRKNPPVVQNQTHVFVTVENPNNSGLISNRREYIEKRRDRRQIKQQIQLHNPNTVLDAGVHHGGNAYNASENSTQDSSISSFENNLRECYNGKIIINEIFPSSMQCQSSNYLEMAKTLKVVHNVLDDGYFYYIFYSDNDIVKNDIHAVFDIYKPTFQYTNKSDSKACINKTECNFDVGFLSDELVIVEVPTEDGFKKLDEDSLILISVCQPRVSVYILFPVAVLLIILAFAFL